MQLLLSILLVLSAHSNGSSSPGQGQRAPCIRPIVPKTTRPHRFSAKEEKQADKSVTLFTELSGTVTHREAQCKHQSREEPGGTASQRPPWGERPPRPASSQAFPGVSPGAGKDEPFWSLRRRERPAAPRTGADEPHQRHSPQEGDAEQHDLVAARTVSSTSFQLHGG